MKTALFRKLERGPDGLLQDTDAPLNVITRASPVTDLDREEAIRSIAKPLLEEVENKVWREHGVRVTIDISLAKPEASEKKTVYAIPEHILKQGKLADISHLTFEQKDAFMQRMKGGEALGAAAIATSLTLYEACEVLNENIENAHYLAAETKR